MPRTATNVTGVQMRNFLQAQAKKRQKLLDSANSLMEQAGKIEEQVFKPMELNPETFLNGSNHVAAKATGGTRAKKGAGDAAILALLKTHRGKITTKDAIENFEQIGFRTAANAVLMKMKRKGTIANPERGVWTTVAVKGSK